MGLLPGSRLPEALSNLLLMLQVLGQIPEHWASPLQIQAALVPALSPEAIAGAAAAHGWRLEGASPGTKGTALLRRGELRLELLCDHFWEVLQGSDLLLAMAGTATEQAVGLGKPVLQLVGPGPQFTEGFADAQRRLLGPAVSCACGPMGSASTLRETAQMAAGQLGRLADPQEGPRWRRQLQAIALERLGRPGGTQRMAEAIMAKLDSLSCTPHATPSR